LYSNTRTKERTATKKHSSNHWKIPLPFFQSLETFANRFSNHWKLFQWLENGLPEHERGIMTRKIAVLTVGRSDFGIYVPVLRRILDDSELALQLIVSGAHTDARSGHTLDAIREDHWPIAAVIPGACQDDTPAGVSRTMGAITRGMTDCFESLRPDLLLVLGDRFDMFAAISAAVPFGIPIAHIHGGELTEGAMDEQFRHAITKLSHLHFASTREYANRLIQLGEEPWRVTLSGAPALDQLATLDWLSREDLEQQLGIDLEQPPILITFHPETRAWQQAGEQVQTLLTALEPETRPLIFTYPNVDMGSSSIISALTRLAEKNPCAHLFQNLGTRRYFSLMKRAAAMIGNSSSGIIESGSFHLPTINIGTRQAGRTRGPNIIDCPCETPAIRDALQQALSEPFRQSIATMQNPYGTGHASRIITERLKNVELGDTLLRKKFHDIPFDTTS
jgi:UDP-hydrolysing UDP-N-acetyl-D-glucosamine 2-epimerase